MANIELDEHSLETRRYLFQISHISRSELWVASDIWLVPFNSRAPVVTEFIVKNCKKLFFLKVYHFTFSQYFLGVKP